MNFADLEKNLLEMTDTALTVTPLEVLELNARQTYMVVQQNAWLAVTSYMCGDIAMANTAYAIAVINGEFLNTLLMEIQRLTH
jgi:hypothetical protein